MSAWVRIPHPRIGATTRVFVFHHAGGSANLYLPWSKSLPETHELALVELPGRGARSTEFAEENFHLLFRQMLPGVAEAIDRPSILFGHSLGALCAFEVARALEPDKQSLIKSLGLSSFLPPTEKNQRSRLPIAHLPDDEFVQRIQRYSQLPAALAEDSPIRNYFLSLIRKDIRLIESYVWSAGPKLAIPSLVFAGREDQMADAGRLNEWRELVDLQTNVIEFPGGHFHVFNSVDEIVSALLKI